MTEQEPAQFSPRTAQEVLAAQTEFLHDDEHGEGIRFTTSSGATLDVFLDDRQPTAVYMDNHRGASAALTEPPLEPTHGTDWIGFRGTTEDGITQFAALRKTGDLSLRVTGPRDVYVAEQAATEALEAQLAEPAAERRGQPAPGAAAATEDQSPAEPGAERGELVSFTGNLGREPLVTGPEGKPRVKLLVAEHKQEMQAPQPGATWSAETDEQTVWHEVWTVERNGPKVVAMVRNGVLRQGVEVTVKGYEHRHPPTEKQPEGAPFVRAFLVSPIKRRPS